MTDLFFSSNGYGNDYLKSGPRWSEQPGPPHHQPFPMPSSDEIEASQDYDHPQQLAAEKPLCRPR